MATCARLQWIKKKGSNIENLNKVHHRRPGKESCLSHVRLMRTTTKITKKDFLQELMLGPGNATQPRKDRCAPSMD